MNVNYPSGGIASLLSAQGRDGDSMLVHMSPNEVRGLQNLAMAAGGSLSINPDTGLYEASFLKKLLPTLLGIGLSFIPGVGPLAAAGLVGAGETIRTGDLGKGLMAGLGAYGGAGLSAGLSAAAGAGSKAALQEVTTTAAKKAAESAAPAAFAQAAPAAITPNLGAAVSSKVGQLGQGISALGNKFGREAFMSAVPGGMAGIAAGGMGIANALTPEMKPPKGTDEENLYYISEGYDPEKGFLGGQYVKKYPGLPGYAEGGDVAKEASKEDLKSYYQSLLAPQQAPQQNAALQQYMSDLNKFVATSGPTAPKTSPTYVAPPPPPPPPPETKPIGPTKPPPPTKPGPFDGFDPNDPNSWMNSIDPDILAQIQAGTFNPFANFGGSFGGYGQQGQVNQPAQTTTTADTSSQFDPSNYQYDPFVGGYSGMDFTGGTQGFDMGDAPITANPAPTTPAYGMQDYMQDYGLDPGTYGDFNYGNMQMYAGGGQLGGYSDGGRMLRGPGDGMSDSIPAEIRGRRGRQPARLADGEFVVPADVVSHLGNGSTEAGSRKLYKMMDNVRRARTGKTRQAPQVRTEKYLPRK
jgi:hypothetical protein